MAGVLIAGAIPTAVIPAVSNLTGLYIVRFFIGILGGTFVATVGECGGDSIRGGIIEC